MRRVRNQSTDGRISGPPLLFGVGLLVALLLGCVIYLGLEVERRKQEQWQGEWDAKELKAENARLKRALADSDEQNRFLKGTK
mgnify:CR=1 FL=1